MKILGIEYDTIISIDPGSNGSIVTLRDRVLKSVDMPKDMQAIEEYLRYFQSISQKVFAVIERQSLWIGDMSSKIPYEEVEDEKLREELKKYMEKNREAAAKVFRLQKLFENYNSLKMLFSQLKFDYITVQAISWQSTLGLVNRNSSETDTEKKNRHKELARVNFPTIQVTHKNADSLLILYFILHKANYDQKWFEDKKQPSGTKIIYSKRGLL